jgi:hypothetical protein
MKTTLNRDESVTAELECEAARRKRTMSDLVEMALCNLFRSQKKPSELSPLPVFHSGDEFFEAAQKAPD